MSSYIALESTQPKQIFQHTELSQTLNKKKAYKKHLQYYQPEKSIVW